MMKRMCCSVEEQSLYAVLLAVALRFVDKKEGQSGGKSLVDYYCDYRLHRRLLADTTAVYGSEFDLLAYDNQ